MSSVSEKPRTARPPEVKFGPYAGGLGVAVWLNTVENADGRRQMRSITIAPRRYRDTKSGEWKDSGSFRPSDIPILLVALNKAMEYVYTTPLPGEGDMTEQEVEAAAGVPSDIPF